MTAVLKRLGKAAPAATTETDLYTVPANTETVLSSIFVANRGTVTTSFTIAIADDAGATVDADVHYSEVQIPPNETFVATVGITLSAGMVVRVEAGNEFLSFSVYGEENS